MVVRARTDSAAIRALLGKVEGITEVSEAASGGGGELFRLACSSDARAAVSRAVVDAGWDLLKLDYAQSELESTFIRLVQGAAKEGDHGSN